MSLSDLFPIDGDDGATASEPNPGLMALLATLSAAQVAPGDRAGRLNTTLLWRTCAADGSILRPDRPAVPTESLYRRAPPEHERESNAVTWTTMQPRGLPRAARLLLAINVTEPHTVSLRRVLGDDAGNGAAWLVSRLGHSPNEWLAEPPVELRSAAPEFGVPSRLDNASDGLSFDFYFLTPQLGECGGKRWFALGERLTKFVPLSVDRFAAVALSTAPCGVRYDLRAARRKRRSPYVDKASSETVTLQAGTVDSAGAVHVVTSIAEWRAPRESISFVVS